MSFYTFLQGIVPLGDNNLARAKKLGTLPIFSTIAYPQFRVRRPLRETQPPQLFLNQAAFHAGIGGLISGGIVFQSLSANPNPQQ